MGRGQLGEGKEARPGEGPGLGVVKCITHPRGFPAYRGRSTQQVLNKCLRNKHRREKPGSRRSSVLTEPRWGWGGWGSSGPGGLPHLREQKLYSSVRRAVSSCRQAGSPIGEPGRLGGRSLTWGNLANEGLLGFTVRGFPGYATATHDRRTAVTAQHNRQTGGTWERRRTRTVVLELGSVQEPWLLPLQTHGCSRLDVRDTQGPTWGAGGGQG